VQRFRSDGTFINKWGDLGTGDGEFNAAWNVSVDATGIVYVADSYNVEGPNHRIQKFRRDGTFMGKWGSLGTAKGRFDRPTGIATDDAGNVYVTELHNDRIQKFHSGNGFFGQPHGIAVDSADNIYVVDAELHRVQKFTSEGAYVLQWGGYGSGPGQFNGPLAAATDSANHVYVAGGSDCRVQKFTSQGDIVMSWGSCGNGDGQGSPSGITVDVDNNVWVSDTQNHRVQKFRSDDGTFLAKCGSLGSGNDHFNTPSQLDVDGAGYIYVADSQNSRVKIIDSDCQYVSKWGVFGHLDGQLRRPRGIALDSDDSVYVVDESLYKRFQTFTATGTWLRSVSWFYMSPVHAAIDSDDQLYLTDSTNARIHKYGYPREPSKVSSTDELRYIGAGKEINNVQMSLNGTTYAVSDSVPLRADAGCTSVSSESAECSGLGVSGILVKTGSGDDTIVVGSPATVAAKIIAGAGNDNIVAGAGTDSIKAGAGDDVIDTADMAVDKVSCGGGIDVVVADSFDVLKACEQQSLSLTKGLGSRNGGSVLRRRHQAKVMHASTP
jgi:sugar lactone lactonase YvrE